ncbi:unnamed protein product [marine sediment metagenome]|uniref:Uncharacterized protein n=1 Tax=marine sediment metagenome TaxID=412755 RepID=X1JE46_9ZZZZ
MFIRAPRCCETARPTGVPGKSLDPAGPFDPAGAFVWAADPGKTDKALALSGPIW